MPSGKESTKDSDTDDASTSVPTDDELSEWEDEDDDHTNWWSDMYSRSRPKRASSATSVKKHENYEPSGRGRKDYSGEQKMKSAAAMMLMTLLYPARLARFDLLKAISFLT